jgi:hypothetical protein
MQHVLIRSLPRVIFRDAVLAPSMRTPGVKIVRGRWGRSPVSGGLWEAFAAYRVAVLLCCTASELVLAVIARRRS